MDARKAILAIDGGPPVRETLLPYGRQWVDEEDIGAVVSVLRSDWLTTGPAVEEFEQAFAEATGAREAVAMSSGTAALHASVHAAGIGRGDEVIVPAMTFAATANSAVFQGAEPVFADIEPDTLLMDPEKVEEMITPRTRAIIAVDYAGQPCDYTRLGEIADSSDLALIADACHSLGGLFKGRPVGSLAPLNTFSLHPVKAITSGEGGVVTTDHPDFADAMRRFRNHGITTDSRQREKAQAWYYEMTALGYNYRMTDFQCALGKSQLKKLGGWVRRRQEIAHMYNDILAHIPAITPLFTKKEVSHAYHLYVIKLDLEKLKTNRDRIFQALRAEGIGVNVHYIPVHLHPFYRNTFHTGHGLCPVAEAAFREILTLPLHPRMTDDNVHEVLEGVSKVIHHFL